MPPSVAGLPWTEPLLRAVSGDYRRALAAGRRLRAEMERLPETPINQQSSRIGFQIYRRSGTPLSTPAWVEVELADEVELDAVVLVPIDAPAGDFPGPGFGFPRRFRVDVISEVAEHTIANHTKQAFAHPGGLPVWIPATGVRGRRVRITMIEPWMGMEPFYVYGFGEIMLLRGNRNLAAGAKVTSSEPPESLLAWGRPEYLTDSQSLLGPPVMREAGESLGYHSSFVGSADVVKWVQVDLGEIRPINEVRMIGGYVRQLRSRSGFGFPVRFKIEAANEPGFERPTVLVDVTRQDYVNPANNPVTFQVHDVRARYVRVTATRLWEREGKFVFVLSELQVYSGDQNVAQGRPVQFLDRHSPVSVAWDPRNLTDGIANEHRLSEWPEWLRGLSRRRELITELVEVERRTGEARLAAFDRLTAAAWSAGLLGVGGVLLGVRRSRRARRREGERIRQAIASDLHDEIGSNLGSIALLSEMGLAREGGMTRADVEEIRRVARQTADSMRDIVALIQRPATSAGEFVAHLREIAGRMLAGLEWTLDVAPGLELPSLAAQRHLLLTFKEALHNVRKHASARHVAIDLSEQKGRLRLCIRDDGVGFDPAMASGGHGLANLRQRATSLEGEFAISSSPGAGTTLVFSANPRARA